MGVQPEDLNDDVVTEILLRLPSAGVLCARAVCKAWHRITKRPAFIAAHARRRPLELIVQRYDGSDALDTIPVATLDDAERRSIHVRYPGFPRRPKDIIWRGYTLIASCDGLLLFLRSACTGRDHLVCNPVTRQWTMLPRLPGTYALPCGFYIHGPARQHRVLWLVTNNQEEQASHYVSSLEQIAESRRVGAALPLKTIWDDKPLPCLNHRGKLHWLRHPEVFFFSGNNVQPKILAFDTVSETFRQMSRPPYDRFYQFFFLLEMEGMLAMTAIVNGSMDVWVLEDYNDDRSWKHRLRVDLPQPLRHACWAMNADVQGPNVLLLGDRRMLTAGLYDLTEKRVLKQFKLVTTDYERGLTLLNALVFRDSLETHAFFNLQAPQYVHSPTQLSDTRW